MRLRKAGVDVVLAVSQKGGFEFCHRDRNGTGRPAVYQHQATRSTVSFPRYVQGDLLNHQIERPWFVKFGQVSDV